MEPSALGWCMGEDVFQRVVELCGFSEVLGPGIVRRALADEGGDPLSPTTDDFRRALPRLEKRMRAYMPDAEAQARARRIRAVLRRMDEGSQSEESGDGSFGRTVEILRQAQTEV